MRDERGGYLARPQPSSLADVVEVILDKGLVIDAYVRVSLVGIELLTIDARIVVSSVDTFLRFAEATNRLDLSDKGGEDLLGLATEGGPWWRRSPATSWNTRSMAPWTTWATCSASRWRRLPVAPARRSSRSARAAVDKVSAEGRGTKAAVDTRHRMVGTPARYFGQPR